MAELGNFNRWAPFKPVATIVGRKTDAHPSFMQAYHAGVMLKWVSGAGELERELWSGQASDLVIFDSAYQSEDQCSLCRALVANGRRVICIGSTDPECGPCHIRERDLLSAMLAAVAQC